MTGHPREPTSPFGPELWDVLARFAAGESPAQEADAVRRWLAHDPQRADLFAALERTVGGMAFRAPAGLDVEAAWRKVSARAMEAEAQVMPIRRSWGTIALRMAAAIALLVGAGYVALRIKGTQSPPDLARTFVTPVGRTDSIRLDDGSRVVLGPGSVLVVASGYGRPQRYVTLEGEALFDVIHDEAHPFLVSAGTAVIEDIGTTFTVRNDAEEPIKVVVTAGSVRLSSQGPQGHSGGGAPQNPIVLHPGDRATVDKEGKTTAEFAKVTPDDLAWTRGQLVFDNAPLGRVRADLRRWYGVDLRVNDPVLANRHLTASFAGEPVQRVLDVIGLALGAKIERHGDTAVVRAR